MLPNSHKEDCVHWMCQVASDHIFLSIGLCVCLCVCVYHCLATKALVGTGMDGGECEVYTSGLGHVLGDCKA